MSCSRGRRFATAGVALAVLGLSGACTAAVSGHGDTAGSRAASRGASPSATAPVSGSPTSAPRVPAALRRTPDHTAIGDAPSANMCKALHLSAFEQPGFTAGFLDLQSPPDCTVSLSQHGAAAINVTVLGLQPHTAQSGTGRTTRSASGLPEYVYPYETGGLCRRIVVAQGINLSILALAQNAPRVQHTPTQICAAADAMGAQVAAAVATRSVPRLPRATPSIGDLDFCAVLRKVDVAREAPELAVAPPQRDAFAAGCAMATGGASLYVDFSIIGYGQAKGSTTVTIDGHALEAGDDNNSQSSCRFTGGQRPLPNGFAETVIVTASASNTYGDDLCTQTAHITADFLTAAGLD